MQKLHVLNGREIRSLQQNLTTAFGCTFPREYVFLLNNQDRLFIVNRDFAAVPLENLHLDRVGLYVAEWKPPSVRLSKEGSQLLVQQSKKVQNRVELTAEEARTYFQGQDLEKSLPGPNRFVILTLAKKVLGCAKYKEGKILNFLPKVNRGEVIL